MGTKMPESGRRQSPRHDAQLLDHSRALSDPTRYEIFQYIADAPLPVGVAELTEHLGLHHNAIRQHLAKLREAGLVVEESSRPAGRGRPALRYRPNHGAADRWSGDTPHEELAIMLIGVARGGVPRDVGHDTGVRLAQSYRSLHDPVEVAEAVARQLGFEPRRVPTTGGCDVVLGRCPFASTAALAPEIVCELHRGLAEGITSATGQEVRVTDLLTADPADAHCRISLEIAGSPGAPRDTHVEPRPTERT